MDLAKELQSSRIVYIHSSKPSTSSEQQSHSGPRKLDGKFQIKRSGKETGFAERMRIGVG